MQYSHRPEIYRVLSDNDIIDFAARYPVGLITIAVGAIVPDMLAAFPADEELAESITKAKTFQELARAIVKTPEHAQAPAGLLLSQITGIPPIMLDYIADPYHGDVLEPWWF